eukprot:CAMPEP_0175083662 /NCGR_PEP_ID=MMETSP0052_2-20121109/27531_1 /TAXON_ID=51329 ORGANISM="Polytomella parva, Strain SAG 63-3" /NCGR_SAMPLE_ID=MMETSP0052_2 /ASSEMBLY_ACC=CAM_ASM_000194 /LENGTH=84 /DNA_ID=CAMNT_0016355185 /DNA_START=551 /DNA_END=805 /DNA_ORIENTATION=-
MDPNAADMEEAGDVEDILEDTDASGFAFLGILQLPLVVLFSFVAFAFESLDPKGINFSSPTLAAGPAEDSVTANDKLIPFPRSR